MAASAPSGLNAVVLRIPVVKTTGYSPKRLRRNRNEMFGKDQVARHRDQKVFEKDIRRAGATGAIRAPEGAIDSAFDSHQE